MLSPVKIFDGDGKLKEIISRETLEARHWKTYKTNNSLFAIEGSIPNKKIAVKIKNCSVCKSLFETTHTKALYCGNICAGEAVKIKRKNALKKKI